MATCSEVPSISFPSASASPCCPPPCSPTAGCRSPSAWMLSSSILFLLALRIGPEGDGSSSSRPPASSPMEERQESASEGFVLPLNDAGSKQGPVKPSGGMAPLGEGEGVFAAKVGGSSDTMGPAATKGPSMLRLSVRLTGTVFRSLKERSMEACWLGRMPPAVWLGGRGAMRHEYGDTGPWGEEGLAVLPRALRLKLPWLMWSTCRRRGTSSTRSREVLLQWPKKRLLEGLAGEASFVSL
mmetsp:Transcript_25053/g.44647  ORF Transcript_25053/g.44647 Transcript_25053/m.44647 type:complete len:241 (-) Transcript_25053:1905-2627(-)